MANDFWWTDSGRGRAAHRRAQLFAVATGVAGAARPHLQASRLRSARGCRRDRHGVWEEFIVEATEADAALLQANHAIILFGLIQLLKFAPHFFVSLEVIGDAGRAGPGTPD